jgi:hypothetical protein
MILSNSDGKQLLERIRLAIVNHFTTVVRLIGRQLKSIDDEARGVVRPLLSV